MAELLDSLPDIYRRLIRTSFYDAVKDVLPVTLSLLGENGLKDLVARFLAAGGPKTSFYHAIPGDLVAWAMESGEPNADLMHYEWIELLAARHPFDLDRRAAVNDGTIFPNPTIHCGIYARPVHTISAENPAPEPFRTPSAYLVWRRPVTDRVVFHRAGLLIARALEIAAEMPLSIEALTERLAAEASGLGAAEIGAALESTFTDLRERDGILA